MIRSMVQAFMRWFPGAPLPLWWLVALACCLPLGCQLDQCYGDVDCSTGETCRAGTCLQTCVANSDCESGQECRGELGSSGRWANAPVCEAAPKCDCQGDGTVCVDQGASGLACAEFQTCQTGTCAGTSRCQSLDGNTACLCSSGDCGPKCSSDDECSGDFVCDGDRCNYQACERTSDCPSGSVCGALEAVPGLAVRVCVVPGDGKSGEPCSISEDCKSRYCAPVGGARTCLDTCQTAADCDGTACSPSSLLAPLSLGVCLDDDNGLCGPGEGVVLGSSDLVCTAGEACASDSDCLSPATCQVGVCACAPGGCGAQCTTSADCSSASGCVDGRCQLLVACSSDDDCGAGEVCTLTFGQTSAGNHCVERGTGEPGTQCSTGSDCRSAYCTGTCEQSCVSTSECGDTECVVKTASGGSSTGSASPSSASPSSASGTSTTATCTAPVCGCAGKELCSADGVCAEGDLCTTAADCGDGLECQGGVCLLPCTSSRDCSAADDCAQLPGAGLDYCYRAGCDCRPKEVCVAGECVVPAPCNGDDDCSSGICVGGQCVDTCERTADCAAGLECRATTLDTRRVLMCGPALCGCDADAWCQPNASGTSGLCAVGQGCSDCDPSSGYRCASLSPPLDAAEEACVCQSPVLCGKVCASDDECFGTNLCIDGRCAPAGSCQSRADCLDGDCLAATDSASASCGALSCDCAEDEVCGRGGVCAATSPCVADGDCAPGRTCQANLCLLPCASTADCDGSAQCTQVDALGGFYCVGASCDCSDGEVCRNGQCLPAGAPCAKDSECDGGKCLFGQCAAACERHGDCPDGTECVATGSDTRSLLCGPELCRCDDPDAWCLPNGDGTAGVCYRGDDCSSCGASGYQCASLPVAVDERTQACGCVSSVDCGRVCSGDADCPAGTTCAPFGRCAAPNACTATKDCAAPMDCTLTSASATVGTCSAAVCGCDRDEMCLAAGSGLGVCTTGAACSVLADDCPAGYGCDPGSGLCTCDEPGPCGRRCSSNADCVQGRLCIDGRCGAMDCRSDADCPGQAVCGGPLPSRTCVQPGTSADGAICRSWTECKSGYCFAANSCATPCEVTTDCGAGKLCQNADPTTFPGELPVCLAQTTLCDPPCQDDQRCNNDPNNPTCLP